MNRLFLLAVIAGAAGLIAGCQTTSVESADLTATGAEGADLTAASTETEVASLEYGTEVAVSDPDYDPNEIICKRRKPTGTRIGRVKDCRTAEQWKRSAGNASRSVNTLINDASSRASE